MFAVDVRQVQSRGTESTFSIDRFGVDVKVCFQLM